MLLPKLGWAHRHGALQVRDLTDSPPQQLQRSARMDHSGLSQQALRNLQ
jgi:hypothetical protein